MTGFTCKITDGNCSECTGDLSFWDFNVRNYCVHCGREIEGME